MLTCSSHVLEACRTKAVGQAVVGILSIHSYMINRGVGHQGRSDHHPNGVTVELWQCEWYATRVNEEVNTDCVPG
jgi:hypothetical protein